MNKFEEQQLVFTGFIAGIALTILGFYMLKSQPQEPQKLQSNFEVVDTYKGCDIVRYDNPNLANYQYFLDCRK